MFLQFFLQKLTIILFIKNVKKRIFLICPNLTILFIDDDCSNLELDAA